METHSTDFNPIVMTFEQYQEELKDRKKEEIKARRATRHNKNTLRVVAWSCMALSLISAFYFNSEVTALLNISMAIACAVMIKNLK